MSHLPFAHLEIWSRFIKIFRWKTFGEKINNLKPPGRPPHITRCRYAPAVTFITIRADICTYRKKERQIAIKTLASYLLNLISASWLYINQNNRSLTTVSTKVVALKPQAYAPTLTVYITWFFYLLDRIYMGNWCKRRKQQIQNLRSVPSPCFCCIKPWIFTSG